jgi:hypothetical protein
MRKVNMYILSLWLLFLLIFISTVRVPLYFGKNWQFVDFWPLLKDNMVAFISLLFLLWGIYAYFSFNFVLKGSTDIPFRIKKIKPVNYEHLVFLATYIIPLVCFNFTEIRQIFIFVVLLVVMGIIYIRTDLFYANPTLALIGFNIYEVDGEFKTGLKEGIIIISKNKLSANILVSHIKLDERIFYVKK